MSKLSDLLKSLYASEEHFDSLCKGRASLKAGDARNTLLYEMRDLKKKIAAEDKRLAKEKRKWMK